MKNRAVRPGRKPSVAAAAAKIAPPERGEPHEPKSPRAPVALGLMRLAAEVDALAARA